MENNTNMTKDSFFKKLKENRLHPAAILSICLIAALIYAAIGYGIFKLIDTAKEYTLTGSQYEEYYKDLFEDPYTTVVSDGEFVRNNDGVYYITDSHNYSKYQICADYNENIKILNVEFVMYNLSAEYLRFSDSTDLLAVHPMLFINGKESDTSMNLNYNGEFEVFLQYTGTFKDISARDNVEIVVFDRWNRAVVREKIDFKIAKLNFEAGKTPLDFSNMNTGSVEDYTGYFYGRYYGENDPNKPWYQYYENGEYYCEPGYFYDRLYGFGYSDEEYEVSWASEDNTSNTFPCTGNYSSDSGDYVYIEDKGNNTVYLYYYSDTYGLICDKTLSYDPVDYYTVYFTMDGATAGIYSLQPYKEGYSMMLTDPYDNLTYLFFDDPG